MSDKVVSDSSGCILLAMKRCIQSLTIDIFDRRSTNDRIYYNTYKESKFVYEQL